MKKQRASRKSKVDMFIIEYCQLHNIKLLIDPNISRDDGCCYPQFREIHLAPVYSSQRIKIACFFHEVAHISVDRYKNQPYNSFECEFLAWSRALQIYKKYFGKSFSKTQAEFMLKCLQTYCHSQYEFQRSQPSEDTQDV